MVGAAAGHLRRLRAYRLAHRTTNRRTYVSTARCAQLLHTAGKLALVGNIPIALLTYGTEDRIDEKVQEYCTELAPGGGYVLSSSGSIAEGVPPEYFVAMTQAVHKYGRYGALGQAPASLE